jgi:hypothetical protein
MLGATLVAKGKAEGDAQNSVAGWYKGFKGYEDPSKGKRDPTVLAIQIRV